MIRRLLVTGTVAKALEAADKERGQVSQAVKISEILPPLVLLTTPDQPKIEIAETTMEVRALARPMNKHPITSMRLLLNGRPYPGADGLKTFTPPRDGETRVTWKVQLTPGKHHLAVQADSAVSKAVSESVEVIVDATRGIKRVDKDKPPEPKNLPSLYVLAVGVSAYPGNLKLDYAHKDARVLTDTLQSVSKSLFEKVEVKLLTDKEATRRNILQGLTWLRKQATQRDIVIVMFAGHGDKDQDGKLYLLPFDVDPDDLLSTGVPGEQLKSVLQGLPCRVLVFLDACHSGAVDGISKRARAGLTDDLVRDLVTNEYGVIVMCSATGKESALESASVEHGFFTLAIVEGLKGKADYNKDGVIDWKELDLYVTGRVKALSKGRQHPVTPTTNSLRNFPLSQPAAEKSRPLGTR